MAENEIKPSDEDDEIIDMSKIDEDDMPVEVDDEQLEDEELPNNEQEDPGVTEEQKIVIKNEVISKETKSKDSTSKNAKDKSSKAEKTETSKPDGEKPEGKFKKLWKKYLEKKKITIPLTVIAILVLLFAIPVTRYNIAGLFIKRTIVVDVVDSETGKPVSEADVTVDGKSTKSDGNGNAQVASVRVGTRKVSVTKKYYQDVSSTETVTITQDNAFTVRMVATGRQVPVEVTNSIDGKAVKGASVSVGESKASTDDSGQAIIVLSPESTSEKAVIAADNFNQKEVDVKVVESLDDANKFIITPAGKIYFLSKQSGKIDVVKTNLDGTDRQTVLAGTGREDEFSTTLLASRDWRYLALHAKRDDNYKLYLISTADDSLSVIDEGDANFSPVGWYNEHFIFSVSRNNIEYWQPKQTAIKSFNAITKQLITLDETKADGTSNIDYASETLGPIYILENEIVFSKTWSADYYSGGRIVGKQHTINSIRPNGSDQKTVKEFEARTDNSSYLQSKLYKPQEIYFQYTAYTQNTFYEYEDERLVETTDVTQDDFNGFYPTFLVSPSGIKTFWYEPRDGKNTLFIGNKNAEDEREVATLSEYQPYGWFTDDYVLESKNGSELYISSPYDSTKLQKISDYHKPSVDFYGYGYGYGGL